MSLVEKALQKLQANRPATQAAAARQDVPLVVGTVERREKVTVNAASQPNLEVPRPAKIVRVDRSALRLAGLIPPEQEASEISDQFRAIKRPLIRGMSEPVPEGRRPPNLLMIASALPGDGKTFTSINLALSMALERNFSVLLVDADVAKPHVTRMFGAQDEPGLLDVLVDPSRSIESVILGTDVPSLSLLPAGRQTSTATELLASDRMREIANRLAAIYSRGAVVLDSSPILLTNEPRVLAPFVGHVIIVVKAGITPQQAVQDSIELIGVNTSVSLVLNEAPLSGPMGYYYGHRYGYGTNSAPAPSE